MTTLTPISYEGRVAKLRAGMQRANLKALVVSRAASIYYTAGCYFHPFRPGAAVIIPLEGDVMIVARAVDLGRLPYETWIREIRPWVGWQTNSLPETSFEKAVVDALRSAKCTSGRIGIEIGMDQEPGRLAPGTLDNLLAGPEFVDASKILDHVMMRKEPQEILLLKKAAAIADVGARAALDSIRPGMRETEVAGAAEFAMRQAGAEWYMAGTTVASGFRAAYAFAGEPVPTDNLLQRGDVVHLDFTPVYKLYLGDHIAMAVLGEPNREQAELAKVVESITEEYLDKFRVGAVVADIDRFARQAKTKAGFGQYDCWINGHGMGLAPRTPPYFTPNDKTVLEADMVLELVLQIHPPKIGGMALEFAVHITDSGPVPLNKTPRRLHVVAG